MITYLNQFTQNLCSFEELSDWSIVKISGLDNKQYFQNHITIDLHKLKYKKHILCANCNSKGRVKSILRVFCNKNDYFYIQRSTICDLQIFFLIKYAIFSKVEIKKLKNYSLISIVGKKSKSILLSYFSKVPNCDTEVVFLQDTILLWFSKPIERFLLILNQKRLLDLKKFLLDQKIPYIKNRWLFLDIVSGVPIIDKPAFQKFFPQNLNLDYLKGIDFNKGCYCGQEMISKIHFKNLNNKQLYSLIGRTNIIINIFSIVEMYNHGVWKKIGEVIYSFCIVNNIHLIQCVLKKNMIINNRFRLALDQSSDFVIYNSIV